MDEQKLSERLRFDIKFLLWRAEVYALSTKEIESRFHELRREYMRLAAEPRQQALVTQQLNDWHPIITAMASTAATA